MRIKIFTAKTVALAMADVRREIGTDAVIIQVEEPTRKIPARVVAAIEQAAVQHRADMIIDALPDFPGQKFAQLLRFHGVDDAVAASLQNSAESFAADSMTDRLVQALEMRLQFRTISLRVQTSALLIGQPGQGKSLTVMRLAAAAKHAGRTVRIITLDGASAGAVAQLEPFCAALDISLQAALPVDISVGDGDQLTLVDTAGLNPYALADMEALSHLLAQTRIEPIWVTACGADSGELLEQARIFSALGARRVIATRADSCRRFGALINLLAQGNVALAGLSASPFMADPLVGGSAVSLAQKLVATAPASLSTSQKIAA